MRGAKKGYMINGNLGILNDGGHKKKCKRDIRTGRV